MKLAARATLTLACGLALAACGGKGTPPGTPTPTGDESGAVTTMDLDDGAHYDNMADLLRGKAPGLEVIERGNGDIELRLRGVREHPTILSGAAGDTLGDGSPQPVLRGGATDLEPLLIIDGMPISPGHNARALKGILPSQVESVVVLKDVSSTAVYGPRGAQGVVEIKLKKAR